MIRCAFTQRQRVQNNTYCMCLLKCLHPKITLNLHVTFAKNTPLESNTRNRKLMHGVTSTTYPAATPRKIVPSTFKPKQNTVICY